MPGLLIKGLTMVKAHAKLLAILAIVGAAIATLWKAADVVYEAGRTDARAEYQAALLRESERAVQAARAEWEASARAALEQVEVEKEIVEVTRVIERKIPVVVESVAPACRDLGPDVLRMFNAAVRGISYAGGDASPSAHTSREVP